jgi:hypothetical protein
MAGTYTLTVTDSHGCTGQDTTDVTVNTTCDDGNSCTIDECVNGECVHTPANPDALFNATGTFPTYNFIDQSTPGPSGAPIDSWTWDFGDSSPISTDQNPTHTFPGSGTYGITLKVVDQNGCWDTCSDVIAGEQELVSIGDYVWCDQNCNGIQDAGERGISGVTVILYKSESPQTPFRTTVTDSSGHYIFNELQPGGYYVRFVLPSGYTFAPSDIGDDSKDSDANLFTGRTTLISLGEGVHDDTWDAGLCKKPVTPPTPQPPPDTVGGEVYTVNKWEVMLHWLMENLHKIGGIYQDR